MPKPIIINAERGDVRLWVDSVRQGKVLAPMELDRKLRQKRSAKYMEVMTKLDAGGHVPNRALVQALLDAIREELPEITVEHLPVGILAKCYLEPPHDVHCLDLDGAIVQHYHSSQALPPLLERGRGLAIHGGYAFIEVYRDCLRAVKSDGTISVVKGD